MNWRGWLGGLLLALCLATLWGVWGQRSQLAGLRAEQQRVMALVVAKADGPVPSAETETVGAGPGTGAPALEATPELLRLRSEVTRLTERRRELAGVRPDNERLRAELTSRSTNATGRQFPPGYVRKSEARLVGYNTPEDTLQSLLWAVQNRDWTNVLHAFTPERAEALRAKAGDSRQSMEEFFADSQAFVGMRVVKREQNPSNGSVAVEIEVLPGEDRPRVTFQQTNGQWKIADPF